MLSFVSLAVVCFVAFFVLRWLGRRGVGQADDCVRVLGRCFLEPRRSVYVIESAGRCFLVGVGDGPMTMLAEIDRASIPNPPTRARTPATPFGEFLGRVLGRRGR